MNHNEVETLSHTVCEYFGLDRKDFMGGRRYEEMVYARHLFCYIAWNRGLATLHQLARYLNHRNHATIINSRDRVQDWIDVSDKRVMQDLNAIMLLHYRRNSVEMLRQLLKKVQANDIERFLTHVKNFQGTDTIGISELCKSEDFGVRG